MLSRAHCFKSSGHITSFAKKTLSTESRGWKAILSATGTVIWQLEQASLFCNLFPMETEQLFRKDEKEAKKEKNN